MYDVRQSWTDERLDDFRDEVNRRFDKVEGELRRVNDRLDGMQRTMVHGFVAMTAAIIASNAALISLFATQL
jgi:uncharacterized protein YPO0396